MKVFRARSRGVGGVVGGPGTGPQGPGAGAGGPRFKIKVLLQEVQVQVREVHGSKSKVQEQVQEQAQEVHNSKIQVHEQIQEQVQEGQEAQGGPRVGPGGIRAWMGSASRRMVKTHRAPSCDR